MGFFEGFEKAADETRTSPALVRAAIAGGAGTAIGGISGREIGGLVSRIPPAPWTRAGEIIKALPTPQKKQVQEVIESLGRSRGALTGAAALGLLGVYLGAKPSIY